MEGQQQLVRRPRVKPNLTYATWLRLRESTGADRFAWPEIDVTPGSFLTMSGAIVLVGVSIYDLWFERVVVEVGRRRRTQALADLSAGSPVAMRLQKFGLSSAPDCEPEPDITEHQTIDQPADTSPPKERDILEDLAAFHAWVTARHAGAATSRQAS